MSRHEKIDYIEFSTPDMAGTKGFFTEVFGWNFPTAARTMPTPPTAGL